MKKTLLIFIAVVSCLSVQATDYVNPTYSPDSTKIAFTRDNDLYVMDAADSTEVRLTFDGSETILNGYASWVYYEEIFGRPSMFRAFWWSPDGKTLGFYRFDNSEVPMFPIYSPKGQDGSLNRTRYPKVGENNPKVRIGMVPAAGGDVVWADFDENEDQYFGTPFWGPDSKSLYISREPRRQNELDLYCVSSADGSKKLIYHEEYKTWLDWIEDVIFTEKGLYMVRSFETGWQQIYFLSYDGSDFRRLTDGPNWKVKLIRVEEKAGNVYFTARRDATIRTALYKVDRKGRITTLTDPAFNASNVEFSEDGKYFTVSLSNYSTPDKIWKYNVRNLRRELVEDTASSVENLDKLLIPQSISITTSDGLVLPGAIIYPKNFDPEKKYPVHMDIYGGPDHPMVTDRWNVDPVGQWCAQNGIIEVVADCRAAGHNGRAGLDMIYRQLGVLEVRDFVEWADYLKSLPYVDGEKIGVEGFSFGGTMTALLVMEHPDAFHYGIAGGGVYDWSLYDSHYTERFMDTPQANPEGYESTKVIGRTGNYPVSVDFKYDGIEPVMLMLTHGTGDDNVHFQNTLQLIDVLQSEGKKFQLMIYPDGKHGYHEYQAEHAVKFQTEFWLKYLIRR
ncbi:MAG: DPP IV N-terminal domain-containing protein [Bacteroidales bacterium]|nr:DPP IV N-terminal domain-containing protein [Bacteroidales bacterium]